MGLDTSKCYYVSREMTIQLAAARSHQEMSISASRSRGVQKYKKFESEWAGFVFPLDMVSKVTKKNFSSLAYRICPALATKKIQRKF